MALPKSHRLPKKSVELLFSKGKTVKNPFFFIRFLKNEFDHARVAAIISSKIFKRATDRNRLKRIIRQTVRENELYREPFDAIVVATQNIVGKLPKEIKRELKETIDKIFVK